MPFAPFHELFADVAPAETRSITILTAEEGLPRGTYGFLESFCNEEDCDCRRAFISVVSADEGRKSGAREPLAVISFGWEKESFYRDWASFPLSKEDLAELKGPALARLSPQSQYAPVLLQHFKTLLDDADYRARIVRHYQMFREAIDGGKSKPSLPLVRTGPKTGRNEPCPCGSGKKFKKCCSGNSDLSPPT